jgi:glutamate:GABA antiporter
MSKKAVISSLMMAMICFATTENIANIPLNALYGFSSVFYIIFAFLVFFIPLSLVSAELATAWPSGGVYHWVKDAFGSNLGFLAIWLQWIQNVAWFPSVLIFISSTFAFIFDPELANNKIYLFSMFVVVFWGITLINFLGIHISGLMTTICTMIGSILPATVIILLGIAWFFLNEPIQIEFTWHTFLPNLSSFSNISLLSGIILTIAGMEMSAVYANDMSNPQKNYPKAVLIAFLLIFTSYSLGALSLASVIPEKDIGLGSGAMSAFRVFFDNFHISWATPFMAVLMTIGAVGMLNNWVLGPARGLLSAAHAGDLPPIFRKENKNKMPVAILVIQGVLSNIVALVILFEPTVNASYWIFYVLTAILYLLMYLILFAAAIRLRYVKKDQHRPFKVPVGNKGMWVIASIGFLGALFGIVISFVPPEQIPSNDYELFLVLGVIFLAVMPPIVHFIKHHKWKSHLLG